MIHKYRFEAFLGLICLGFFLTQREVLLTASLDPDEIFSWNLATGSFSQLFSEGLKHCQQYFYYLILKLWTLIFPSNDYWIRMPSLIFGVGTIASLFYLGRRLFKLEHLFIQGLILYLYPQLVFYSTYARPYALLTFLASINLYFIHKTYFSETSNRRDLHFFLSSMVLLLFTHHIGAIYLVCIFIALLLFKKNIGRRFDLIPYQIFIILYLVQFIIQKPFLRQAVSWIEPLELNELPGFVFNNRLYLIFFILPVVSLVFAWFRKKSNKLKKEDPFILFNFLVILLFTIGIGVGSILVTPLFVHRHFYLLLPTIVVLSVFGLEDLKAYKSFVLLGFLFFILGGGHKLYTKQIVTGGTADTKTFMRTLSNKVDITQGFTCVQKDGFSNFLKNYSMQYYNVDICKKYSTKVEGEHVILINIDEKMNIFVPPNYSSLYKYSSFTVLKRN